MKTFVSLFMGLQLAVFTAHAAVPAAPAAVSTASEAGTAALQQDLSEIARVATIMIDGDVCQHIVTPRALQHMLREDPRDEWQAGDNYDVNNDAFIQTKKTLIRLAMLAPYPVNVNLWMPVPTTPDIQLVIHNKYNLSQFSGTEGRMQQTMPPEMLQVLKTGKQVIYQKKPGMISVLAPVRNSLGEIVGLVEVVSSTLPPPPA
jgi:hypothetical protein